MKKQVARLALVSIVLVLMVACESISYYGQAAKGQLSLLMQRQDIERLLRAESLPQAERDKLLLIMQAREFAAEELGLPVNGSYRSYVELERPFVVWNVFAAPALSNSLVNWCYPIAGCVSYRGYFSQENAETYADQLRSQGMDVFTGGVDAYSTLGWFNDPITSAQLRRSDSRLVALLFHELAHQLLYVPDDTSFNEGFATFVEREGLRRWMVANGDEAAYQQFIVDNQRQVKFIALVQEFRQSLGALYTSELDEEAKLADKQRIQQELRQAYEQQRETWGYYGYDGWFAGPLNNAQLATVSSYNDLVPAFAGLLARQNGNLELFYTEALEISRLPSEERRLRLAVMAQEPGNNFVE